MHFACFPLHEHCAFLKLVPKNPDLRCVPQALKKIRADYMKRSSFSEWVKHSRATPEVVSPASKPAIIIINKHINLLFWESSVYSLCAKSELKKQRIPRVFSHVGILHTFTKSRATLFPHHGDFLEVFALLCMRTQRCSWMYFCASLKYENGLCNLLQSKSRIPAASVDNPLVSKQRCRGFVPFFLFLSEQGAGTKKTKCSMPFMNFWYILSQME